MGYHWHNSGRLSANLQPDIFAEVIVNIMEIFIVVFFIKVYMNIFVIYFLSL